MRNATTKKESLHLERLQRIGEQIALSSGVTTLLLDAGGRALGQDRPDATALALFQRVKASGEWESQPGADGLTYAAQPVYLDGELELVWILSGLRVAEGVMEGAEAAPGPLFNQASLRALLRFAALLSEHALRLSVAETCAREMSLRDRLLGIPNMRWLEQDIADDSEGQFANLIVLDIADLRKINDVYGREFGDELLRAVYEYIKSIHIPSSRIYRMEGADFGVLMGSTFGADTPRYIAQKLYDRCLEPWVLYVSGQKHDLFITANICTLSIGKETNKIFRSLDSALKYTKEIAKKTEGVVLFEDVVNDKMHGRRIEMELSLRRCVRENMHGFAVHYQPIIDPGIAVWHGMEALCRWNSPEFGPVSPAEFIEIAEECGLIGSIGFWVLEQSLAQVKQWGLDEHESFLLEVNLSPVQLVDPDLYKTIVGLLRRYNYPPHKLCLEVTESNDLNFSKNTLYALERLHEIGVSIALDDFGTGYAALGVLHRMPISIVKTDRSLINGMESDIFLQRLFYVMVELAHSSEMKIVAEGVETDVQAQLLLKQGADFFQGFLFSRPLPAEEIEKNLQNFYRPSGELVEMGYARLDLTRLSDESGGYDLTPSLYKLLNQCMHTLFYYPDPDAAIDKVLAVIGEALRVSRSYVFIKEKDGTYTNTNEWCAPGVTSEKADLQQVPIADLSPAWIGALIADGLLVASDIRTLDEGAQAALGPQGIKAVVEFPIWDGGELIGFVGFDDCVDTHAWTREEVQMLHTLTGIIAATLSKMNLQSQVEAARTRLENMLNSMDTMVYVSDLDTDEILFANDALRALYNQDLVGGTCWKVLQHREGRCEFCPKERLKQNPKKSYQWEHYNGVLDGYFRIRDSVIRWGERMVHMEYAENITEYKKYHQRLEEYATTDMLTATYNRATFEEMARSTLSSLIAEDKNATVGFVDIDGLKAENDKYGHAAGDQLICDVVQSLRANIRSTDMLGRYGGDEFILLFSGCSIQGAERSMRKACNQLSHRGRDGEGEGNATFSYGLASLDDVKGNNVEQLLRDLTRLADERMMQHKRERGRHR